MAVLDGDACALHALDLAYLLCCIHCILHVKAGTPCIWTLHLYLCFIFVYPWRPPGGPEVERLRPGGEPGRGTSEDVQLWVVPLRSDGNPQSRAF